MRPRLCLHKASITRPFLLFLFFLLFLQNDSLPLSSVGRLHCKHCKLRDLQTSRSEKGRLEIYHSRRQLSIHTYTLDRGTSTVLSLAAIITETKQHTIRKVNCVNQKTIRLDRLVTSSSALPSPPPYTPPYTPAYIFAVFEFFGARVASVLTSVALERERVRKSTSDTYPLRTRIGYLSDTGYSLDRYCIPNR